ncbi:MAG: small subunit ribosomal protein S6e [Patescibacteria group bacterium]|jgi:small subunit ribosomal protein S6e
MAFKINVAHNGKTFKVESENEELTNHAIGNTIDGSLVSNNLSGYELAITGTSDKAGFCGLENVDGPRLHKVLLSYEKGMKTRPKLEGKRKRTDTTPKGLRLRKTVRGKDISLDTVQINTKVTKEGAKPFEDLFKSEEPAEEKTE